MECKIQGEERFNAICEGLVKLLDDKVFVADSLQFVTSLITGLKLYAPPQRPTHKFEVNPELSLPEKIKVMETRATDARLTLSCDIQTLRHLSKHLILRSCSERFPPPELNTPEVLYRAFSPGSYSRYDKDLGFRSSRQPFTLPSYYRGPLEESSLIDRDGLTNHCVGKQPSDLIAMSGSPRRVMNHFKGDMIAVINVSKLLAMRVLFNRTTTLCETLDIETWAPSRPKGLN